MKWILPVVLMGTVLFFAVSGCGPDQDRPDTLLKNAAALYYEKDYHRAADSYRQVIADYPDAIEAWTGLARTRIQRGDIKGASEAYQRIVDIQPDHVEALLKLARFDLLAGNLTSAEQKTDDVLRKNPDNTEALFLLTDLYSRSNRLDKARATLERILPLVSDKTDTLTGLARIQSRAGDLTAALKSLEQAVILAPNALEPRLLLFNYFYGQGDFPNAEKTLLQAIEANPENATLQILLGQYYLKQHQPAEAESAFLEAVRLEPDQTRAYLIAGNFYSSNQNPEAALKMFQKAGRLNPQDVKIAILLAEFYLENNSLDLARQTITQIQDEHPGYFPARLLEIKLLLAQKDYEQAILLSDTYLKSNPAADQLLVLKGVAHVYKGELKQAEAVLSSAVKTAPANINAKFRLLDVYLKQGKIEQAQHLNREIFSYLHDNFDVTVVLGDTELNKQKTQKGLSSLDSLSRFASANPFDRFRPEHLENLRSEYARLMGEFNRILEKRPDLISIFENIILLHAARKEYDTALAKCDQQIKRLKDTPYLAAEIHNIKAGLYLAQNNIGQAETSFKQAINLAPDFLKPYYGLAKVYIINKDIKNAITQYEALVSRAPEQAQAVPYLLLGALSKMKMNFQAAEDYYRKALAIDGNFVPAANNLAYLLAEQKKNLDEALSLVNHARQLKPDDPYIQDTLGWVYYQKGAYDDAVRELSRTLDLLPESATVNYHLGMAYYKKGNDIQARPHLEKVLQLESDFNEADKIRNTLKKIIN